LDELVLVENLMFGLGFAGYEAKVEKIETEAFGDLIVQISLSDIFQGDLNSRFGLR